MGAMMAEAESLYPDQAPAENKADSEIPPSEADQETQRQAEILYPEREPAGPRDPEAPENVQALRQEDVAGKLYDRAAAYDGLDFNDGTKAILADLGVTQAEARQIDTATRQMKQNPPDQQQIEQWQREADELLRYEFHGSEQGALKDARNLAARDPRVREFLEQSGLGDHPQVVLIMARRARRERLNGRL